MCACRLREIILSEGAGEPNLPVYDTSGPYTDPDVIIDVNAGPDAQPHRLGEGARRRRGISGPRHQAGRQRQCRRLACREILHRASQAAARRRRPHDHAARIRPRRHHHQGDDLRRHPRKPRPQAAARARRSRARRRRKLWRLGAGLRHAGIRAQRDRARPRHHSLQHQPWRTRADDHRPQLPHQDQRQYRQLRGHLIGRGRSRQDGVGDPLGRRHRDGPLDRAATSTPPANGSCATRRSRSAPCRSIRRWRSATAIRSS